MLRRDEQLSQAIAGCKVGEVGSRERARTAVTLGFLPSFDHRRLSKLPPRTQSPAATIRTLIRWIVVVRGCMGVTSNRHWMVTALLALLVAVFVLAPVVDATACGSEVAPAHATSSIDLPSQPNDGPSGDHSLCAHGHCHHGGAVLPYPTQPDATRTHFETPTLKPVAAPLASHSPSGLKRPPRG